MHLEAAKACLERRDMGVIRMTATNYLIGACAPEAGQRFFATPLFCHADGFSDLRAVV